MSRNGDLICVIKRAVARILCSQTTFELFQNLGIHVMPKHFYSPIPDTKMLELKRDLWRETQLVGVDLNLERQVDLLQNVLAKFSHECSFPLNKTASPYAYYINNNGVFEFISAVVLHAMIRHFVPRTIIEIGSGNSTYVAARASLMNRSDGQITKLISIDPYPNQILKKGFPGLWKLIPKKVEEINVDSFSQLEDRDILFVDSSHVVRIGGDVNFLYLEVLPRLKAGVIVHIHDIFFPRHYPKDWVIRRKRFWSEQYLLQAFLIHNNQFEVLWCGSYMYRLHLERLKSVFPPLKGLGFRENYFSSSFWMRRIT